MTKRSNFIDSLVKEVTTSRTFRIMFGSITATIIVFACVITCVFAALIGAFIVNLSGYP